MKAVMEIRKGQKNHWHNLTIDGLLVARFWGKAEYQWGERGQAIVTIETYHGVGTDAFAHVDEVIVDYPEHVGSLLHQSLKGAIASRQAGDSRP